MFKSVYEGAEGDVTRMVDVYRKQAAQIAGLRLALETIEEYSSAALTADEVTGDIRAGFLEIWEEASKALADGARGNGE